MVYTWGSKGFPPNCLKAQVYAIELHGPSGFVEIQTVKRRTCMVRLGKEETVQVRNPNRTPTESDWPHELLNKVYNCPRSAAAVQRVSV